GYLVDVFARFGFRAQAIFNIAALDEYRFRGRRPLRPLFFTGRSHEPLYNVPCVLRAFALIQRRYPEARLTVGGDGGERRRLEQLSRELKLRNTTFTGLIPSDRIPAAYDAPHLYRTATHIYNMPNS